MNEPSQALVLPWGVTSEAAVFTWGQFFLSPGFGGAAAVVAAIIAGGSALLVSKHRGRSERADRTEAQASRQSEEHHRAELRWWDRFVWVTDEHLQMAIETRVELLAQLTREAGPLSSHLVLVAMTDLHSRAGTSSARGTLGP